VNMLLYDIFDEHDDKKDEKEAVVIKQKQEVDARTPLQPKHKRIDARWLQLRGY